MTDEEVWKELIEEVLVELAPRSDIDEVVNLITVEEIRENNSCTAQVNATGVWIERPQEVDLADKTLQVSPNESTGLGEQRITVQIIG